MSPRLKRTPEDEIRSLCVFARLALQTLIWSDPRHLEATVAAPKVQPATIINTLYKAMRDNETRIYSVTWEETPGEINKRLYFRTPPSE